MIHVGCGAEAASLAEFAESGAMDDKSVSPAQRGIRMLLGALKNLVLDVGFSSGDPRLGTQPSRRLFALGGGAQKE